MLTIALGASILLCAGVIVRVAIVACDSDDIPEAFLALSIVCIVILVACLAGLMLGQSTRLQIDGSASVHPSGLHTSLSAWCWQRDPLWAARAYSGEYVHCVVARNAWRASESAAGGPSLHNPTPVQAGANRVWRSA